LAGLQLLRDVQEALKKQSLVGGLITWTAFVEPHPIIDILTNGGTQEPLSLGEIDALCERINTHDFTEVDHSI
jgi:hypothetical protein